MIMGVQVQEKVTEEMALMKMASFSKVQDDRLPENVSVLFPMPEALSSDTQSPGAVPLLRRHCRSLSAPAEASSVPVSGDLSPSAFPPVKENWSGWKWKMMKKNNGDKKKRALYDRRIALEEDVAHLQTQLKTERAVRLGLERALGQSKTASSSLPCEVPSSTFSPKAKELITEIASLETEVASLEQHVLSLYRKVLDTQICPSTPMPSGLPESRMSVTCPPTPAPEPESAAPSPPPTQPRLFSRISLKRKSNALSSSQHRRNGSTPGTPNNEPEDKVVTTPSSTQTKFRHVSLLGGAFNCIDGSSADDIPTTSQQLSIPCPPLIQESPSLPEAPRVDLQFRSSSCDSSRECPRESTDKAQLSQELLDATLRSAPLPLPLLTYGSQSAPVSRPGSERGSGKLYPESPRIYPGSPNRLSEELVRCMASIYCKLADPPLSQSSAPISPASSSSSSASSTTTTSSPRGSSSESWSPKWVRGADNSSEVLSLVDPFQLKDRKGDVVGSYLSAVEVPWICVDKDRLNYAARALRNFRSMVEQLEQVDPGLMKHDEKMAFWTNVYNALMMHAYLAYGIPRSHLKRIALLQKASYKIGSHSINAHTIEHCILGCRARRPTQWLQTLFTTGPKFKAGDERKAYALDKPEPLVCFALCCGGRSDPAIRVYTAKHIRQELEIAKREYLEASVGVRSGSKVLLPRILEWYSREESVSPANLLDWVSQYITEQQQVAIRQILQSRSHKSAAQSIEWLQYNSGFRYIFVRDLARVTPSVGQ
ncbi:unnamed protein product [Calypogeia fissa]